MTTFAYSGSTESTVIATSGYYDILLEGAQGGGHTRGGPVTQAGGDGAAVGGDIYLAAGTELAIIVGGVGEDGRYGAGGGGGTYLFEINASGGEELLAAAGGGGGAAHGGPGGDGVAGGPTGADGSGTSAGRGGTSGGPGGGAFQGGGGGGVTGGAGGSPGVTGQDGQVAFSSFLGGQAGSSNAGSGGFGGGGGGGFVGGGGGGGLGGGGGGDASSAGGGGGSYLSAGFTNDTEGSGFAGEGFLELTYEGMTCYAADTRILTTSGEIAVQHLRVGDLVVTAAGETRPIVWLGHRRVDCRRHQRPSEVLPVRIAAHAFASGSPKRDLFVSPAHAVLVDDALVPAGRLLNGATIAQADVDEVTYWHVELQTHDLLLAEGLAAESYLEAGNRGFFAETQVTRLGAGPDAMLDEAARAALAFCRPFLECGPLVEAAHARFKARSEALGWRLTQDDFAGLHLLADGQRLAPVVQGRVARFTVPAGAGDLWLIAETCRPCDIGPSADLRDLGVDLRRLSFADGFAAPVEIALDDPRLTSGFHELEPGLRRWTAQRALLPEALFGAAVHGGFLLVETGEAALPRWRSPDAAAQAVAWSATAG